jgi:Putative lumazine-binding
MKKVLSLILFFVSSCALAQSNSEKEKVMEPITRLFKGMHEGDSAMVHSAFSNTVTFVSVFTNQAGKAVMNDEPLEDFLKAVGKPHSEKWSEPTWNVVVQVDGYFAQVWAEYAFYVDKNFSHCGVDAFHLIKDDFGGWKIFHLADTRRKEGCVVPDSVKDQFK